MPDLKVYVRDDALVRQGQLTDFDKLRCKLRYADVSSWILDVGVASEAADVLQAGGGIIVTRGNRTLLSGTVEDWTEQLSGDDLTLTFNGYDDTMALSDRLVLPRPRADGTLDGYDTRSGRAETVIKGYVASNLGAGAEPDRKLAGLLLGPDAQRGIGITFQARYQSLLELTQTLALRGGDLGFTIVQDLQTGLVFDVALPGDRAASALFSRDLGNLRGYTLKRTRNTGNAAYVAGAGELAARIIRTRIDTTSIARDGVRREVFVDQRQTDDPLTLDQAGDEELAKRTGAVAVALTPIDTDGLTWGVDYELGDLVTVQGFLAVIRELDLTYDATGELVEPLVGDPGAINPKSGLAQFAARRRTDSRVSNLERR